MIKNIAPLKQGLNMLSASTGTSTNVHLITDGRCLLVTDLKYSNSQDVPILIYDAVATATPATATVVYKMFGTGEVHFNTPLRFDVGVSVSTDANEKLESHSVFVSGFER